MQLTLQDTHSLFLSLVLLPQRLYVLLESVYVLGGVDLVTGQLLFLDFESGLHGESPVVLAVFVHVELLLETGECLDQAGVVLLVESELFVFPCPGQLGHLKMVFLLL